MESTHSKKKIYEERLNNKSDCGVIREELKRELMCIVRKRRVREDEK